MKLIKTSYRLPKLKVGKINQRLNKGELLVLAEKVRKILIEEGKIKPEENEDISFQRNAFSY